MGRGPAGAAATGMLSALYAEAKPEAVAIVDDAQTRTFAALHTRANRLARALRSLGLRPGDALALMCANRVEYVESFLAAMRIGLRITPVNWHLAQEEARYIVENCEAKALVCEAVFTDLFPKTQGLHRIAIGGAPGWIDYETALLAESPDDPPDPRLGTIMLYTSGTTGRPKGVFRAHPEVIEPQGRGSFADYDPETDVNLCPGPAYHAAPLLFDVRWPLASGVPIVLLRQWNSEAVFRAIDEWGITHCHMAPIMFHRLLALPEAVRTRYAVTSLRRVDQGAAPCPVPDKRARSARSQADVGEDGAIYMKADDANPFVYFKAEDKTEAAHRDGYYALGDIGRLDADDFLFLTGRTAECIISGGVNIYPQEIDDVVTLHPAVADACTVGAPNEEMGRRSSHLRPAQA